MYNEVNYKLRINTEIIYLYVNTYIRTICDMRNAKFRRGIT